MNQSIAKFKSYSYQDKDKGSILRNPSYIED